MAKKKTGRKPSPTTKKKQVGVRVHEDVHARYTRAASLHRLTVSDWVRRVLDDAADAALGKPTEPPPS